MAETTPTYGMGDSQSQYPYSGGAYQAGDYYDLLYKMTMNQIGPGGGAGDPMSMLMKSAPVMNPYLSSAMSAYGLFQTFMSNNALNKSKMPEYSLTPEMQKSVTEARQRRGMGLMPEQRAAAENSLARGENTGYQRAVDQAPNLASVIQAGMNYNNVSGKLGLAKMDADARMHNIEYSDNMNKYEQNIHNMNTQAKMGEYNNEQKAWGQAGKDGISNIFYGLTALTNGRNKKPKSHNSPDAGTDDNTPGSDKSAKYGMGWYDYENDTYGN